ncbi:fasciclin domain-containing protein [Clostridium sp. AL.422]|uniref:fasciclin domain-containing protein n=1 Tax=Clostridium TaxID=1485 RepID=UPI00293DE053|nr:MULTISPECIES: fasciclin domain-containing protein [unclassified Clostridium]MDV4151054.1 fasciclin domain-containing protein [Clostridium sp. AL.422]
MKNFTKTFISTILLAFLISILPVFSMYSHASTQVKEDKNIVEIAKSDGRFNTLVEALNKANLVNTLEGKGPFTVFAPTDDAFKKLPAGTLENLLKPENKDTLKNILLYHVAKGNLSSADILKLDGKKLTLLNGKTANITVKDGAVFINNAKIIITDIPASNGTIHVIDAVLIPEK